MDFDGFSWIAYLVAALSAFVLGFFWYGPIFGKQWAAAVGMADEQGRTGNPLAIFGPALLFIAVATFGLSLFLNAQDAHAWHGLLYGLLIGALWIAPALGVNAIYERRSWTYIAINGGYWAVVFPLIGLILGAWR